MDNRRRLLFVSLIGIVGLVALSSAFVIPKTAKADTPRTVTAAQAATPALVLPIAHYSHMLVDPAHQHLFISSGAGYSSILVTDYAGQTVATISGEPGATGLALSGDGSTVYAALANGDAVSAISTRTLKETARYATGTGIAPAYVAYTSGRIWFGYSTATPPGGIGSIDPSTSPATVTLNAAAGNWYSAPMVSASPGGELVAGEPFQSPVQLASYNVSTGTATVLAPEESISSAGQVASTLGSLQTTPDGKDVVIASGAPDYHQVYRVSDLSADGSYPTAAYPNSVSISGDGSVAAGTDSSNEVFVFAPGGSTPLNTYNFGSQWLATDGVALTPDGRELFAVTTAQPNGDSPTLNVITNPEQRYPAGAVQGYHSMCLDNSGSSVGSTVADGNKIDLYTCGVTDGQQWMLNATQGPDGNYTGELVNSNGMCANDAGYGGAGSKVILWSCTGTSNEIWTYWTHWREYSVSYGGHTYCMNDPGYSTTPGVQQIVWTCPDTANELYTLPH